MSTEENKSLVQGFFTEVWQNDNVNAFDEFCSENLVNHTLQPDMPGGIEGSKMFAGMFMSAFPKTNLTVEQVVSEGDTVCVRWSATAAHEGELMGIPATGKQITTHGMGFYRCENGKIAEIWGEFDMAGLMQQISPPQPAEN